jgi:hypothetical protein
VGAAGSCGQVALREKICREHSRIARVLSIRDHLADI